MTNLTRYAFALALALLSIATIQAQCTDCVCDAANTITGNITSNTTLSGCNCIEGYVFVEPGVTLTIDAGTIIKGIEDGNITTGDQASALIVARGATIEANGTAAAPIIFTAETDDICDPSDVDECTQSLWGGLIVLGSAPLNSSGELPGTSPVEDLIEGIPNDEQFARFGGTDANDDSGNLNYISIRHGGSTLDADNEINGLTLGGVGAGTEIDFIEVFANSDDGVEWFGGTVNVKHVVVTNAGDDSFDYDQGSTFNVQFAVSIGSDDCGSNRPGEHDGSVEAATAFPFATPAFSNVTYIGKSGFAAQPENDIILFRDAAGGFYQNSVFCNSNNGINIEADFGNVGSTDPFDSNDQFSLGNLSVRNCSWGGGLLATPTIALRVVGNGSAADTRDGEIALAVFNANAAQFFAANDNDLNPGACPNYTITTENRASTLNILTINGTGTGATSFSGVFANPFFESVSYRGAFPPSGGFWADWTHSAERGILNN